MNSKHKIIYYLFTIFFILIVRFNQSFATEYKIKIPFLKKFFVTINKDGNIIKARVPKFGEVIFTGEVNSKDEYNLTADLSNETLNKIKLPSFTKITFTKAKLKLSSTTGLSVEIGISVLGKNLEGKLLLKTKEKDDSGEDSQEQIEKKYGMALILSIPDTINPVTFIPAIGKVFSRDMLLNPIIIISDIEYDDDILGISIKKGFGIKADIPFKGPLSFLSKIIKTKNQISVYGITDGNDVFFTARLLEGNQTDTISRFKFGKIDLEVSFKKVNPKPEYKIKGSFFLKPSQKDDYLELIGAISLSPTDAGLAATMKGVWNKPFGIKAISISDVACEIAFNLQSGLPQRIGLTGTIDIFERKIAISALLDPVNFNKSLIIFEVNKLSSADFLKLLDKMGIRIPKNLVPQIEFIDLNFKIAPFGGSIGEITFEQGFRLKGKVIIFDKQFYIDGNISEDAISFKGGCDPFTLFNFFKIEGTVKGKQSGYKGPIIDIVFGTNFHIIIFGKLVLQAFSAESSINIAIPNIDFSFEQNFENYFSYKIDALSKFSKNPDFNFKLLIKNDIKNKLINAFKSIGSLKSIIDKIVSTFNIQKIEGEFNLSHLKSGKLPSLRLDFSVFGKNVKTSLEINITSPEKIFNAILEKILDTINITKIAYEKVENVIKLAGSAVKSFENNITTSASKLGSFVWSSLKSFSKKISHKSHTFDKCYNECIPNYAKHAKDNLIKESNSIVNSYFDILNTYIKNIPLNEREKIFKPVWNKLLNEIIKHWDDIQNDKSVRSYFNLSKSADKGQKKYKNLIETFKNNYIQEINIKFSQILSTAYQE